MTDNSADQNKEEDKIHSPDKEGIEVSFVEMGDKKVEQMVRKLGLKSIKGQRKMINKQAKKHKITGRNIKIGRETLRQQNENHSLFVKDDNTPKVSNVKTEKILNAMSKTNRFMTSNTAQAKLIVELEDKDNDLHSHAGVTAKVLSM